MDCRWRLFVGEMHLTCSQTPYYIGVAKANPMNPSLPTASRWWPGQGSPLCPLVSNDGYGWLWRATLSSPARGLPNEVLAVPKTCIYPSNPTHSSFFSIRYRRAVCVEIPWIACPLWRIDGPPLGLQVSTSILRSTRPLREWGCPHSANSTRDSTDNGGYDAHTGYISQHSQN